MLYAWIAQLVERRIEAPGVGSSSLSPGTRALAHGISNLVPVGGLVPTLAVDDRARTLGYSETIHARNRAQDVFARP